MNALDIAVIIGGYATAVGLIITAVWRVIRGELVALELRLVEKFATKEEVKEIGGRLERHLEAS